MIRPLLPPSAHIPTSEPARFSRAEFEQATFAYTINGLTLPAQDVRVELRGPNGDMWEWGDPASPDRVTGAAIEFCLVVTQRRHVADTSLSISGEGATQWMGIAQAFAGPPGKGREPGLTGRG